jgi:hypothetical protein
VNGFNIEVIKRSHMFRAIDKDCGKEIIILDGKWHRGNIEQLLWHHFLVSQTVSIFY